MSGGFEQNGYETPPQYSDNPMAQRGIPSRSGGTTPATRNSGRGGREWQLQPGKSPDNLFTFRNLCAVSTQDFPPQRGGGDILLLLNDLYVITARPTDQMPAGMIGLSEPQRGWLQVAMTDVIRAVPYSPFEQGDQAYLGSMDVELGFASKKNVTETKYDQDDLAKYVTDLLQNQVFAPMQRFILGPTREIPLLFTVKTVQLVDLSAEDIFSATIN